MSPSPLSTSQGPILQSTKPASIPKEAEDPDDPDGLLASLEAEDDTPFRESRAQKLAEELRHARQYCTIIKDSESASDALIQSLSSDDEVLKLTTQNHKCLVHFSHPEFARCATMDVHLRRLAVRHSGAASGSGGDGVRFAKVDVRDTPFVVEKLGVRVLPCLVGFIDGVGVGRVVGFEGLGVFKENSGEQGGVVVTMEIEKVVVGWGVFGGRTKGWGILGDMDDGREASSGEDEEEEHDSRRGKGGMFAAPRRGIRGRKNGVAEDDDEDWD